MAKESLKKKPFWLERKRGNGTQCASMCNLSEKHRLIDVIGACGSSYPTN